jgi:hypothetical protein
LGVLKNEFGEVDEIFQGFESASEQFFCILGKKKETWKKSLKRCFKEAYRFAIF